MCEEGFPGGGEAGFRPPPAVSEAQPLDCALTVHLEAPTDPFSVFKGAAKRVKRLGLSFLRPAILSLLIPLPDVGP